MKRDVATLSISQGGKGIPYGGDGTIRADGEANYGFKYVKGNDAALCTIPELARDKSLLKLVRTINGSDTDLFSVGCLSKLIADEKGFRHTGYVEFAINSRSVITDARSYFYLFFHFNRLLHQSKFSTEAFFHWEIEGADFFEAEPPASGFTCSVFVNTAYSADLVSAEKRWDESLSALVPFFEGVSMGTGDFIYPQ